MAPVTACIAPTDTPAIQVMARGVLATELEVGEAETVFTVLADLRNALYDLDVDVATALRMPSIEDLDALLEQLRDATTTASLECEHGSCTAHQYAGGYCIQHHAPLGLGFDEDEDLGNVDEDGWDRTPGRDATFVGLS